MSEAHAPAVNPFSDAEVAHFHAEDLAAATAVVSLMCGIFIVGVVLYSIVDWFVAAAP